MRPNTPFLSDSHGPVDTDEIRPLVQAARRAPA
jgi:hypothetical protein